MKKIVEKLKIKTLVKVIICIVAISFCFSCQTKQEPKKQYKYKIDFGSGWDSGYGLTDEYKLKDGFYLFLAGKDSIKLKESEVTMITKNNN